MQNLLNISTLPILIVKIGVIVFLSYMLLAFVFTFIVFKKAFGRSKKDIMESTPVYKKYKIPRNIGGGLAAWLFEI